MFLLRVRDPMSSLYRSILPCSIEDCYHFVIIFMAQKRSSRCQSRKKQDSLLEVLS